MHSEKQLVYKKINKKNKKGTPENNKGKQLF